MSPAATRCPECTDFLPCAGGRVTWAGSAPATRSVPDATHVTGVPVPPARQPESHDDALADAIAMVEAIARDDTEGLAAVVANAALVHVAVVLGKLLAEGLCPGCIQSGQFRQWAAEAVHYSS
jgi:hypothetical protein